MSSNFIPRCTTLVFDIGDVIYTWSSQTPTPIPESTLKGIMTSPIWFQYECGRITEEECYRQSAEEYCVDSTDVACAIGHARVSLHPDLDLVAFVHALKAESNGRLRVFAMSNISQPDFDYLFAKQSIDWSVFDYIFTSTAVGIRKPDLLFYKHVLREIGSYPAATVFIDDKAENVLSARSLGMHGVVYDNLVDLRRILRHLTGDPIQRGQEFIHARVSALEKFKCNIGQLLLIDATKRR